GPANYRARIVAADNLGQLESGANYGDPGDFFPGSTGKTTITESTSPNTRDFNLFDTGIRVTNIAYAADTVSFDLQIATKPDFRTVRYTIDDAGGDGLPDPNEAEQLTLTFKNVGTQSGPITLTASTGDPNVTMNTALVVAPAAAAGATVTTSSPFAY